jgi:transcription elongation factor GreB
MSRGFVKEDDVEHAGTDVPERPVSAQPNYVTVDGYAQLQAQASKLEALRASLQTNKDAPSAQQQLAVINRDLRYFSARLENAQVIKPMQTKPDASSQVLFGATVTVEDDEGHSQQFSIVGEDEADIKAGKVSWTSPLAKALISHKVGDSVIWNRPAGNTTLEIINIQY